MNSNHQIYTGGNTTPAAHPLQGWFQVVTVFSYLNVLMVLFCLPFAFGQGLNFLEMRFLTLPAFLPIAFIVASKMGMVTIETFSAQKSNGSGPKANALAKGLTALLGLGFVAAGGLYFGYKTDYCKKEKDSYVCAFFNDPFMEMFFVGALVIIFLMFAYKAFTTIFPNLRKNESALRQRARNARGTMNQRLPQDSGNSGSMAVAVTLPQNNNKRKMSMKNVRAIRLTPVSQKTEVRSNAIRSNAMAHAAASKLVARRKGQLNRRKGQQRQQAAVVIQKMAKGKLVRS